MQTILPERFKNQNKALRFINFNLLLDGLLVILVTLVPLVYTPFSSEFFYSYRLVLTSLISVLLLITWALKGLVKGYIHLASIRSLVTLLTLLAITTFGFVFSANPNLSLFGGFLNLDQPAYYFISLIIIAFITINTKIDYKKLMVAFSASITIIGIIAFYSLILSIYSQATGKTIDLIAPNTLLGSVDRLLAMQIIAATVCFYFFLSNLRVTTKVNIIKIVFALGFLINSAFIVISSHYIFISILMIAVLYIAYTHKKDLKNYLPYLIPILAFLIMLLIISLVPSLRAQAKLPGFNYDPRLNISDSWTISASVLKEKPIFGYGLGNYMKAFALFRPISLNTTPYWRHDILRPFNDLFMWSSVLGLLGLMTYIAGIVVAIVKAYSKYKVSKSFELASIVSAILVLISLTTGLPFVAYIIVALTIGYLFTRNSDKVRTLKGFIAPVSFLVLGLVLFLFVCNASYVRLVSEYYYRNSLGKQNLTESAKALEKAMQINPKESAFIVDYIILSKTAAVQLSKKESLNNDDLTNLATFINYSLKYSELLTRDVDPTNHAFWDLRGNLYADIVSLDPNALNFSVNAYGKAIDFKPLAPDVFYKAGVMYYQSGYYREASEALNRAINLKPNYASAIFAMAHTLEKLGFIDNAIVALEKLKAMLPKESGDDLKIVETDLDAFKKVREAIINKSNTKLPENRSAELNPKISGMPANADDKISKETSQNTKIQKGSAPKPLANPEDNINKGTTNLPNVN